MRDVHYSERVRERGSRPRASPIASNIGTGCGLSSSTSHSKSLNDCERTHSAANGAVLRPFRARVPLGIPCRLSEVVSDCVCPITQRIHIVLHEYAKDSCVYRKLRLGCSGDAVHRGEHVT